MAAGSTPLRPAVFRPKWTVFIASKHLGIHRVAFRFVGPDGLIKNIWPQVKAEEHAVEVLAAL